jgi:hypothetical protein
MIQDAARWHAFEHELSASQKLDFAENLRLVEGMYEYAIKLGKFSAEDALEGLNKNLRLARVINHVRGTP